LDKAGAGAHTTGGNVEAVFVELRAEDERIVGVPAAEGEAISGSGPEVVVVGEACPEAFVVTAVAEIPEEGVDVFEDRNLGINAEDGDPGIAAACGEMIEGIFLVVDEFLALEHEGVVSADGGDSRLEGGTTGAGDFASLILFEEEASGAAGDLVGPCGDAIVFLESEAVIGIEVENKALGGDAGVCEERQNEEEEQGASVIHGFHPERFSG
jgi:hypothetical protein